MCDICNIIEKSLRDENTFFVKELKGMKSKLLKELDKYETSI